jgi:hypothetical protein
MVNARQLRSLIIGTRAAEAAIRGDAAERVAVLYPLPLWTSCGSARARNRPLSAMRDTQHSAAGRRPSGRVGEYAQAYSMAAAAGASRGGVPVPGWQFAVLLADRVG